MAQSLLALLDRPTVIPVVTVSDAEAAVEVAAALKRGGLSSIEITLRTSGAMSAAQAVREADPDIVLGIGTVTRVDQLEQAVEMGAQFAVSPGLTADLADAARAMDIAYLPGICTPSELMAAMALGYTAVKVSPVGPLGGPELIRQLAAVFPDAAFCPTGGITEATVADYLALPAVFAVAGSWLAPAHLIEQRDWPAIESLAHRGRTSISI